MSFKVKDFYFKKAKKDNYLARSIYKLEEINHKFNVIKLNDHVLDLGYYPGSWTQYTAQVIGQNGLVVGCDIKPVNKGLCHLKNVILYEQDAFQIEDISILNVDSKFTVLISDMAPNTTGIKSVDQDRSLNLVEKVFDILPNVLLEGGNLVIKVFDSHYAQQFLKSNKNLFDTFHFLKPKSTRSVSKEFFVIGKGYRAL